MSISNCFCMIFQLFYREIIRVEATFYPSDRNNQSLDSYHVSRIPKKASCKRNALRLCLSNLLGH